MTRFPAIIRAEMKARKMSEFRVLRMVAPVC